MLLAFVPDVLWLSYFLAPASPAVFFGFFAGAVYLDTGFSLVSDFFVEALEGDSLLYYILLWVKGSYFYDLVLGGSFFFSFSMTSQP